MLDSKKRFSKTANVYDKYRPSYPPELIDWIIKTSKLKNGTLVDIGCGTGISTRLFLHKGFEVIGIDPNEEMLAVAREKDGEFYRRGEAAKTGLPSRSVDILIAAQALHWFNLKPTFQEFQRILKPSGWCFAFWHIRKEDTGLLKSYDLLIRKYSKDYSKIPKPAEVIGKLKKSPNVESINEGVFSYSQEFNLQGLKGRASSTSYIAHGVKDKKKFMMELKELFNKYEKKGYVTFVYQTVAIGWQFH